MEIISFIVKFDCSFIAIILRLLLLTRWLIIQSMVILSLPFCANSGQYLLTKSEYFTSPLSTSKAIHKAPIACKKRTLKEGEKNFHSFFYYQKNYLVQ